MVQRIIYFVFLFQNNNKNKSVFTSKITLPEQFYSVDFHPLYQDKPDLIVVPECQYNGYQVLFTFNENTQRQNIKVYRDGTCDLLLDLDCDDSHGTVIDHYYVTALCSVVIDLNDPQQIKVHNLDVSDSKLFDRLNSHDLTVERLIELYQDKQ